MKRVSGGVPSSTGHYLIKGGVERKKDKKHILLPKGLRFTPVRIRGKGPRRSVKR